MPAFFASVCYLTLESPDIAIISGIQKSSTLFPETNEFFNFCFSFFANFKMNSEALNPFNIGISQSMRISSMGHLLLCSLWSYKYLMIACLPLKASTTSLSTSILRTCCITSFRISMLKYTSSTIIMRGLFLSYCSAS